MGIKDRKRIYETLFEGAPDAIFVEDATGKVLDCTPAAAALHGMTREEIIGRNAAELVPPQHRHRTIALQANPPREFEAFSLTADGRSIPVAIRTSRIDYLGQP